MKTKVEIEGFEIEIEFENGVISVKAEKDDEVIEEFTIETEEGQFDEEEGDDIKGFDDFDEEDDFEGDDFEGDEDDFEGQAQGQAQGQVQGQFQAQKEDEVQLESFQSFINKSKKVRRK
jgi:hypothetical protein